MERRRRRKKVHNPRVHFTNEIEMKASKRTSKHKKNCRLCIAPCSMCCDRSDCISDFIFLYMDILHTLPWLLSWPINVCISISTGICVCVFVCVWEIQMPSCKVHSQCVRMVRAYVFKIYKVKIVLRCIEMISWCFGCCCFFRFVSNRNVEKATMAATICRRSHLKWKEKSLLRWSCSSKINRK